MVQAHTAETAALLLHWRSARSERAGGHEQSQSKHSRAPEVLSAPPISHQHCRQSGNQTQRRATRGQDRCHVNVYQQKPGVERPTRGEARLRVLRRRALCRTEVVSSHALRSTLHRRARQQRQQCETEQEASTTRRRCNAPLPSKHTLTHHPETATKVQATAAAEEQARSVFFDGKEAQLAMLRACSSSETHEVAAWSRCRL